MNTFINYRMLSLKRGARANAIENSPAVRAITITHPNVSGVKLTSAFPHYHAESLVRNREHVRPGNPARIPVHRASARASAPEIRDREFAIGATVNERLEILTLRNSSGN